MLTCWHAETVAQRHVHTDKTLTTWHAVVFTCWPAGRLTLTCWNAYYLTRWDTDMVIYRLEDTLTCWHFDMLTGCCACRRTDWDTLRIRWCWHSDITICKLPDTVTYWLVADELTCSHADMQTRRHADADTLTYCYWQLTCLRADDVLTCGYADELTWWHADTQMCKHADRLTCWHVGIETYRHADTWTYCYTEVLTRGLCERHWGPCVSVQSPLPFKTINF